MMSDDLDLTPRLFAQLPLQRALIRAIGIEAVIDEVLPNSPRHRLSDAAGVVAMILHILSGQVALYNLPVFFVNTDAAVELGEKVPLDARTDARLAACLDHLFEAGTDSVLGQVARRFLASGKGGTSYSVHADTKDTEANRWNLEKLAGLLPPAHEATLVGDSKLLDAETIGQLLHEANHFVSLVPHSYQIRAELVERVPGSGTAMAERSRRAGARKGDAELVYRGPSFLDETLQVKHPQTGETRQAPVQCVVVESDARRRCRASWVWGR